MADKKINANRDVTRLAGALTEARKIAQADAESRARATTILNPKETRGNYDAGRLLMTTLGGVRRLITADDLAAFRLNIKRLGDKFTGGIAARQVIELSLPIDRERAKQEINVAFPMASQSLRDSGGKVDRLSVRFITNASLKHGATRHFVTVEFLGYPLAIASGESDTRAASAMKKQSIRFDCSCKKHTFFFRYVATVGGYNAGRNELGYPKIRNPGLAGCACKHVLRVMAEVESSAHVQSFLTKVVKKGRDTEDGSARARATQKEADKNAERTPKEIRTSSDIASRQAKARELAAARTAARTAASATPPRPRGFLARAKSVALGIAARFGVARDMALNLINSFRGR